MASQIRLRLTGKTGSGICVLMEEAGRLRYRLSLEGPPGGELTVWLQGRSPYMELTRRMDHLPAFTGRWQTEGECEGLPCATGWIWVLRGADAWLMGAFPGVSTPPEAAWQAMQGPQRPGMPPDEAKPPVTERPALLVPPPGVAFLPDRLGGRPCFTATEAEPPRRWTLVPGLAGEDPFSGCGLYCAAAEGGGYWLLCQNVTEL